MSSFRILLMVYIFCWGSFLCQITVTMHTVNAVLLLGDALLNCLVISYRHFFFSLWNETGLSKLIYTFSKSPCFGYLCLFYGRALSSFSSGPFMLLYQYGNVGYPFDISEHPNSIEEKVIVLLLAGGHTHSLTYHHHIPQFGTFSQLILRPLPIVGMFGNPSVLL